MRKLTLYWAAYALLASSGMLSGQEIVKLWADTPPPVVSGIATPEQNHHNQWITEVTEGHMAIFTPKGTSSTLRMAVLICPGGGYGGLAYKHEGLQFAEWLNSIGAVGIVLKYRLPNHHKTIPLDDVHYAMHHLRANAAKYGIAPNRLGIAGFSAGGHLAGTASTHWHRTDGAHVRPDFAVLFYPVTTLLEVPPGGTCTNLLGPNPEPVDMYRYSVEKQVNNATPPTLLMLSNNDDVVHPDHSVIYYEALKRNGIPAAMYIFPTGGHGWGMNTDFAYREPMLSLLQTWLKQYDSAK